MRSPPATARTTGCIGPEPAGSQALGEESLPPAISSGRVVAPMLWDSPLNLLGGLVLSSMQARFLGRSHRRTAKEW